MTEVDTSALDELEAEHDLIKHVLSALEAATPETADARFFDSVIRFIARFADGCHHEKEERFLFPTLAKRGMHVEMGPIGVMLLEHEMARDHVTRMRELIAINDVPGLCAKGREYAQLMRAHIAKEEAALFPLARGLLTAEDRSRLRTAFDGIETPLESLDALRGMVNRVLESADAPSE